MSSGQTVKSFEEAEKTIMKYVEGYNTKRIHSSIGYRTPDNFYNLKNSRFKENLVVKI